MTATGHAIIGTVIAAKIGNPLLAVPIALGSHFLADLFPHWDTGTHWKKKSNTKFLLQSALDVLLSFSVSYALAAILFPNLNIAYAFVIVILSQLPDWLTAPYLFFKIKLKPFVLLYKFQHKFNNRLDKPWGIVTQVAALVSLLIIASLF